MAADNVARAMVSVKAGGNLELALTFFGYVFLNIWLNWFNRFVLPPTRSPPSPPAAAPFRHSLASSPVDALAAGLRRIGTRRSSCPASAGR